VNPQVFNRSVVAAFILLMVLPALIFYGYNILTITTIRVVMINEINLAKTKVFADGKPLSLSSSDPYTFTYRTRPGDHLINVRSEGFEDSNRQLTLKARETIEYKVELKKSSSLSAQEAALLTSGGSGNIQNAKYFGNNTWLVFFASTGGSAEDGTIVIAKKNTQTGDWEIIEEGTDIDTSSPILGGAPTNLFNYMETL
jgi:PEGA domain